MTPRQLDLLRYIDREMRMTGVAPSFEQMKTMLELRSKSGVFRLVGGLVEGGYITRRRNRSRAIEISVSGYRRLGFANSGSNAATGWGFDPAPIRPVCDRLLVTARKLETLGMVGTADDCRTMAREASAALPALGAGA